MNGVAGHAAMDVPYGPYATMMGIILFLTPLLCWSFTRNQIDSRVPMNRVYSEIKKQRYYLHISGYLLIILWKKFTDNLNEPFKTSTGHYTDWVHGFEGECVLWIQAFSIHRTQNQVECLLPYTEGIYDPCGGPLPVF